MHRIIRPLNRIRGSWLVTFVGAVAPDWTFDLLLFPLISSWWA